MTSTLPKRTPQPASRASQRGMSMSMALVVMAVVVFFGTFAFKAAPAYFDNWTLMKVVDQVTADDTLMRGTRKDFYRTLNAQLDHNNLWAYKAEDIVELKKAGERFDVKVNYEKRENLFSNIDLVMHFDKEIDKL